MLGHDCTYTHEKGCIMASFIAGGDDLTFDFSKFGGPVGIIPEPSSQQIADFLAIIRKVMPTTKDEETGKEVLNIAEITERFGEEGDGIEPLLNGAVSEVCSNAMSPESIEALPYRVKQAFYGWVLETFLSPEA